LAACRHCAAREHLVVHAYSAASTVTLWQTATLAAAANVVGAWSPPCCILERTYFVPGAAFALGLGTFLLVPLIIIALSRVEEIAQIAFGRKPRRLIESPPLVPEASATESFDSHPGA